MRFILKIFLVVLALSIMIGSAYVGTAPSLPPGAYNVVKELITSEPPSLYQGETGFAQNGDVSLWYEHIKPQNNIKGTVLLVMGHSTTGINWSEYFYKPMVDSGYSVIRYDNRGVGMSDWIIDWHKNDPYSLEDMALDGMAILDKLNIEKAHVVGASMGGMIAQRMAISHNERVSTLTSIMSSGYMTDPEIDPVPSAFTSDFRKLGLKYLLFADEEKIVKFSIAMADLLKGDGDYHTNIEKVANRTLFELRNRNGFNPKVGDQHTAAIEVSGSRFDELPSIAVPTLVIHGTSDPLVIPSHAKKYAPLIPGATILWVNGMGHDIPPEYTPEVHEHMLGLFKKVQ